MTERSPDCGSSAPSTSRPLTFPRPPDEPVEAGEPVPDCLLLLPHAAAASASTTEIATAPSISRRAMRPPRSDWREVPTRTSGLIEHLRSSVTKSRRGYLSFGEQRDADRGKGAAGGPHPGVGLHRVLGWERPYDGGLPHVGVRLPLHRLRGARDRCPHQG